jgi:hypothetical protein
VVRALDYRFRGPGSIPGHYKKLVDLERGPLSLVSTTEELFDRKVAASPVEVHRRFGGRSEGFSCVNTGIERSMERNVPVLTYKL